MPETISEWVDLIDPYVPPMAPTTLLQNLPIAVQRSLSADVACTVLIEGCAIERLFTWLRQDPNHEHMAIPVGSVFLTPFVHGQYLVVVRDMLPVKEVVSRQLRVAMTPESWPSLWKELGLQMDRTILGWAHSHPSLGVFFSAEDHRTQRQWFQQPWHIAIVADPLTKEIAAFVGPDALPAPLWHLSSIDDTHPCG
jgi:proteasome lid subunit RPN8/RPN11